MTLALHPTNPVCYLWASHAGLVAPSHWRGTVEKTCSVCHYELIDGWCSRCDLEENGVLV